MRKIIITNIRKETSDVKLKILADVINGESNKDILYFETSLCYDCELNEYADPFLVATLFYAMRSNSDIHIEDKVTYGLLRNIERFQKVWCCWKPELYHAINITADEIIDINHNIKGNAIQTFSGGLDSTFTTYQHVKKIAGKYSHNLTTAVMVHGFDIPLEDEHIYQDIFSRSKKVLATVGVELIPLKTNFRDLWHKDLKYWEHAFGTGMSACILLFARNHSYGLIASSEPYNSLLLPWGSNPISDPLLSSSNFIIEHDACEYTRGEKVSIVSDWSDGINNLRVCWQGNDIRYNCCRCEKCIRTILNFKSIKRPVPLSFPLDININDIISLRGMSEAHLNPLRQIIAEAIKHDINDKWVDAVKQVIAINEKDISDGIVVAGQLPYVQKG